MYSKKILVQFWVRATYDKEEDLLSVLKTLKNNPFFHSRRGKGYEWKRLHSKPVTVLADAEPDELRGVIENMRNKKRKIRGKKLSEICKLVNDALWIVVSKDNFPNGIKTKTRKREIAYHRYLFYNIAEEFGYGPTAIASFLDMDHASIVAGRKRLGDLRWAKDKLIDNFLTNIENELKKRSGSDGAVQYNPEQGVIS